MLRGVEVDKLLAVVADKLYEHSSALLTQVRDAIVEGKTILY
jgi:hypothetical protein